MPDLDTTMQALAERLADKVVRADFTQTTVYGVIAADEVLRGLVEATDKSGHANTLEELISASANCQAALALVTGDADA